MIKKHYKDVKEEVITKFNSTKTTIRWLITKEDGAERYTMRRFEIQPGGQIGVHSHLEEHEIFILQGDGLIIDGEGNELKAVLGDVLYVPPNERHGYINNGTEPFVFICVIPYF